jgi:hypothetical protein
MLAIVVACLNISSVFAEYFRNGGINRTMSFSQGGAFISAARMIAMPMRSIVSTIPAVYPLSITEMQQTVRHKFCR